MNRSQRNIVVEQSMKKRVAGFTLLELLTVIAVIAILAAILTPVFARAKVAAYRNNDIAKMNEIRTALGLYKVDQGAYPPQLLGYVTLYSSGPNAGNVIPADGISSYLYSKRVGSIESFKPANARYDYSAITSAVYPTQDSRPVGSAPIEGLDLNGDGIVDASDDTIGARQAYGPADGFVVRDPATNAMLPGICSGAGCDVFYRISGFDVAEVNSTSGTRTELRYSLFWTNYAVGDNSVDPSFGVGSPFDDPRQLGYTNPPDDTVVTWNTFFRDYDSSGLVTNGRADIILTLGGSAKPYTSREMNDYSWRQGPLGN